MILQQRIDLLIRLGKYIDENGSDWQHAKDKAFSSNHWFVPEFIQQASIAISKQYLQEQLLYDWAAFYELPIKNTAPKIVGLVMAGNIPLVGFHDMLCIFISGHKQHIKCSSKDEVLPKHLVHKLIEWEPEVAEYITIADKLTGCEAYITTGSNNTSRYFDYYFGKFPHIIRKNRTSVAILQGNETAEDLDKLADDIQMYFGLGCRNVTKLYVPTGYNFEPLLKALNKYEHFGDYHKYRHNYDYQLALLMMGNIMYMTNGTILFAENESLFTAVSRVNFAWYTGVDELINALQQNTEIQCLVGAGNLPFGQAQHPHLMDYADGVDTMRFLIEL